MLIFERDSNARALCKRAWMVLTFKTEVGALLDTGLTVQNYQQYKIYNADHSTKFHRKLQ